MYDQPSEITKERLRKIRELKDMGINLYPATAFSVSHDIREIRAEHDGLIASETNIRTAGRVVARRQMGKAFFLDLQNDGTTIQLYIRRNSLEAPEPEILDRLDLGDFIGVEGQVFFTKKGELSINVDQLTLLGKTTHPLPLGKRKGDQLFDSMTDRGELYRHRHIDLITNPGTRTIIRQRAEILRGIRDYLYGEGFIEIETPIVAPAYSGAAARPFLTHLNALDQQMYLRVSPEPYLKRAQCGDLPRVFEIGKNFRNEGVDASHNPEFTMLEWYEAFSDYLGQMERFETLVALLCERVNGTTKIQYRGRELDLTPPWPRLTMLDALNETTGYDFSASSVEEMNDLFERYHPEGALGLPEPLTWGGAIVELFESLVESNLWGPVFVMDHPVEISPLTKRHRSDPRLVERFEPIVAGMEVGNAYSELNDPVDQYQRLMNQQVSREDAYGLDQDFLYAIAQGLPQAGGTGLGVDRIVMILTGAESIRDVILFPSPASREPKVFETKAAGNIDEVPKLADV